ncbi:hypothetical protein JCM5353_005940 [Sporobolomyces roseus]
MYTSLNNLPSTTDTALPASTRPPSNANEPSPNPSPLSPRPLATTSAPAESNHTPQKEIQRPSDWSQLYIDSVKTILQEEPPKASASSIPDSGRSGMAEEVEGLRNELDQAERFPQQSQGQPMLIPRRSSTSETPFNAQLAESIRKEALDSVVPPPSPPPQTAPIPSQRPLPPPPPPSFPSAPPAPSAPSPISMNTPAESTLLGQVLAAPSLTHHANLAHQVSVISTLPPRRPAPTSAPCHLDPIPSTSSETRPHPSLPPKPASGFPPPIDIDISAAPHVSDAAHKRFYSNDSTSEKRPQKRQRPASDRAEVCSKRAEKGKARDVSMELEEGEVPVSADDEVSDPTVYVSSKSRYNLTLPQLDFSLDRTQPRPLLHKTAKKFFREEKDSLYARFKKKASAGKWTERSEQARQLLVDYVVQLRRTDPSRIDDLSRHFAAYEAFCRHKNIETFPIVSAKLALAFYDFNVGFPHLHGPDALLALKEVKSHTSSPWSSTDAPAIDHASTVRLTHSDSTSSANRFTARQIDLPQPGDTFPTETSLYCHVAVSLVVTWGYSAVRTLSTDCAVYRCSVTGCDFKIKAEAATKLDKTTFSGKWKVLSTSRYDHTHNKREALLSDPDWRPTLRKEDLVKALKQFDENGRLDDEDQVKRAWVTQKKVSRFVPDPSAVLIGGPTAELEQPTPTSKRTQPKSASHIAASSSDEDSAYSASSASPEPISSPRRLRQLNTKIRETSLGRRAPSPEFSAQSKSNKSPQPRPRPSSPKAVPPSTVPPQPSLIAQQRPSARAPVQAASSPTSGARPSPPAHKSAPPTSAASDPAPITPRGSFTPDLAHAVPSTSAPRLAEPTIPPNPVLSSAGPAGTSAQLVTSDLLSQPIQSTSASPAPSASMPPPRFPSSSSFFAARQLPPHLATTTSRLTSPLSKDTTLSIPPELISFISALSPPTTSPDKVKLIASILFRAGFDSFEAITELVALERETRMKMWEIVKLEIGEDKKSCEVIEGIERRIFEGGQNGWMG